MHHKIELSFVNGRVHANPNPLPDRAASAQTVVRPGDTVTWSLAPPEPDRELQVVFLKVIDLDSKGDPAPGPGRPCNPLGPLNSLSIGARTIVGAVRSDISQDINHAQRFLYKVVEAGVNLEWDNPVPPVDLINGGGIDTPRTPP